MQFEIAGWFFKRSGLAASATLPTIPRPGDPVKDDPGTARSRSGGPDVQLCAGRFRPRGQAPFRCPLAVAVRTYHCPLGSGGFSANAHPTKMSCGDGSFWFVRPVGRPVHLEALGTIHALPHHHKSCCGPGSCLLAVQTRTGVARRQPSTTPPTVFRPRRNTAKRLLSRCSGASSRSASVTFWLLR